MGLFRRAKGECPACGREKRSDVGEKHHRVKMWPATCRCGEALTLEVDPAWWLSYRDNKGKYRRRKIGPDHRAARRVLAKVQVELSEGTYIDRRVTCKVTLAALRDGWLASIKPERSHVNYKTEATRWNPLVRVMGASTRIDKITEATLDAYRRQRSEEGLKVASVNRELAVLGSAMSWAVQQGMIRKRPRFVLPNPNNARLRFVTKSEAKRLLLACDDRIRPFVQAALATGMRRGELSSMKWGWIDLQTGMINLPATATKNKRARHVPISDDMRDVILEARERAMPGCPNVLQNNGRPLDLGLLGRLFRKACDKAGIEDFTVHDLRHTCASWLVMGGTDLYTTAAILGHLDIKQTQRYAHLAPGHLQAAMCNVNLSEPDETEPSTHPAGHQVVTGQIVSLENRRGAGG